MASPVPSKRQRLAPPQGFIPEELDIFTSAAVIKGTKGGKLQRAYAKNALDNDGPLEFEFSVGEDETIDPTNVYIEFECSIVINEEGTNKKIKTATSGGDALPEQVVIPVNGLGSSLFKNIEVKLNGKVINSNDNLYMYRADLTKRLFEQGTTQSSSMDASGWLQEEIPFEIIPVAKMKELAQKEANLDLATVSKKIKDTNLSKRYLRTRASKSTVITDRLYTDIFNDNVYPKTYIPPNSKINITLTKNPSKFVFLSPEDKNYKLDISKAHLLVRKVRLTDEIKKEIEKRRETNKCVIPLTYVIMKTYNHSEGRTDVGMKNIFTGPKPKRMFAALVNNNAFHGDLKLDPFNYQHFNMEFVAARINGECIPFEEMKIDFDKDLYSSPFNCLQMAVHKTLFPLYDNGINYDNYPTRNVILGFDFSCDNTKGGQFAEPPVNANIDLDITLSKATTNRTTLIIMGEFDAEIELDGKQVTVIKGDSAKTDN